MEVRLLRAAVGNDAASLWRALRGASLRPVKSTARGSTLMGTVAMEGAASIDVVLKTWRIRSARDRIKASLGRSQAHRQWRGGELLARSGIPTSHPLALWRGRDADGPAILLLLELLPGDDVISLLHHGRFQAHHARALGRLIARLIGAGIHNRDHKPSNIIIMPDGGAGIIDTVGIRRLTQPEKRMIRSDIRRGKVIAVFASMVIEPLGLGLLPKRTDLLRGLLAGLDEHASRNWKQIWRAVEHVVREHGDPAPADDPRPPLAASR